MVRSILVPPDPPSGLFGVGARAALAKPGLPNGRPLLDRRPESYLRSVASLDSCHINLQTDDIVRSVRDSLGSLILPDVLLGVLAQCRLGEPFDVHMLTLDGSIIRHVRRYEPLEPMFERARSLATHPAYLFIEIYNSQLVCVHRDGTTTTL